jgi:hypothetical protein
MGEGNSPDAPPVVVWYGSDPMQFSAVTAALKENQIQFFDMTTHSHLLYGGPMSRGAYAIFVRAEDEGEARKIVSHFPRPSPLGII